MVFIPTVDTMESFYKPKSQNKTTVYFNQGTAVHRRCNTHLYSQEGLQRQVNALAVACQDFSLTVSLTINDILAQEVSEIQETSRGNHTITVVQDVCKRQLKTTCIIESMWEERSVSMETDCACWYKPRRELMK